MGHAFERNRAVGDFLSALDEILHEEDFSEILLYKIAPTFPARSNQNIPCCATKRKGPVQNHFHLKVGEANDRSHR